MHLLPEILFRILKKFDFQITKSEKTTIRKSYNEFYSKFINTETKKKHFTYHILKYAIYYFYKYYEKLDYIYIEDTIPNLLICFLISQKFIEDDSMYNDDICKKFELNLKTVNRIEIQILNLLNYDLFIQENVMAEFVDEINKI